MVAGITYAVMVLPVRTACVTSHTQPISANKAQIRIHVKTQTTRTYNLDNDEVTEAVRSFLINVGHVDMQVFKNISVSAVVECGEFAGLQVVVTDLPVETL